MPKIQSRPSGSAFGYTLFGGFSNFNPADSTTYFFGSAPGTVPLTTSAQQKIHVPKAGTIKACYLHFSITGTLGSNEPNPFNLRLNDTTDIAISLSVALTATTVTASKTTLSTAVAQGDYLEVKWAAPAFATNPTGVYGWATIYIA